MNELEKEWFIQAPWGRIAIIAWGQCCNPPVLLCHGRSDSAACFRPLVGLLPENFYYISMEFPGNGKSDHFPPGLMISSFDMVYAIKVVVDHFRWKDFIFIGHSLGAFIGKLYSLVYPGIISKCIELDPTANYNIIAKPEEFSIWYKKYFTDYFDKYELFNSPKQNAPKHTRKKCVKAQAVEMLIANRGLTEKEALMTLERMVEHLDDGLVRFTYDQRMKSVTKPPFTMEQLRQLYASITIPTLSIITDISIKLGIYDSCPFALDESVYRAGNCKIVKVSGIHDVHFVNPELVAPFVASFMLNGIEGLSPKHKL